jgi:hypothetical protein
VARLAYNNRADSVSSQPFASPPALFSVNDPEGIVFEADQNRRLLTVPDALFHLFDRFGRIDYPAIGTDSSEFDFANVLAHFFLLWGLCANSNAGIAGRQEVSGRDGEDFIPMALKTIEPK